MIKNISVLSVTGSGTVAGPPGASAYTVALQHGFVGTVSDWLTSLIGDRGPKGDPGDTPVITLTLIQAIIAGAPTTRPSDAGVVWVNGGVVSITE